jgi:hypothetical protein
VTDLTDLLDRFADGDPVSIDMFGGATSALASFDDLLQHDPVAATDLLCAEWAAFGLEHDAAVAALVRAASADLFDVDGLHDIILTTPDVVASASAELTNALRRGAMQPGFLGDVHSESWTRLALGGWCSTMPLRAHLEERGQRAAAEQDSTPFLVRAIAASWNRWDDPELETTLVALAGIDEFASTVAFERGLHQLQHALGGTDTHAGVAALRKAIGFLNDAGQRRDARAYAVPLTALLRFLEGGTVTDSDVLDARTAVHEYLLGYRGLHRHWRQGRADASRSWSMLLDMLTATAGVDEPVWFTPSDIIEAAAALSTAQPAADTYLDMWLQQDAKSPEPSPVRDGVIALRDAIRGRDASAVATDVALMPHVAAAIESLLAALVVAERPASYMETQLLRRIVDYIEQIVPADTKAVASSLSAVVLTLVQMTEYLLNKKQSGERKISWLGGGPDDAGLFPKEFVLSEEITRWFSATGLRVQVEAVNVSGGDADVAIRFPRHTFYVEVKRVTSGEEDAAASAHYGDQATQYAANDVPITFLTLLDYVHRVVRIDLEGVVWTTSHTPTPNSRTYALTGFRIQAHLDSPSAASRRPRRPARSHP